MKWEWIGSIAAAVVVIMRLVRWYQRSGGDYRDWGASSRHSSGSLGDAIRNRSRYGIMALADDASPERDLNAAIASHPFSAPRRWRCGFCRQWNQAEQETCKGCGASYDSRALSSIEKAQANLLARRIARKKRESGIKEK